MKINLIIILFNAFFIFSGESNNQDEILICLYNFPKITTLFDKKILLYCYFRNYVDLNFSKIYKIDEISMKANNLANINLSQKELIFFYNLYNLILSDIIEINITKDLVNNFETNRELNSKKILENLIKNDIKIKLQELEKMLKNNSKKSCKNDEYFLSKKETLFCNIFYIFSDYIFDEKLPKFFDEIILFFTIYFFEVKGIYSRNLYTHLDIILTRKYSNKLKITKKYAINGLSKKETILSFDYINKEIKKNNEKSIYIDIYLNLTVSVFIFIMKRLELYKETKYNLNQKFKKIIEKIFSQEEDCDLKHFNRTLEELKNISKILKNKVYIRILNCFSITFLNSIINQYFIEKHIFPEFLAINGYLRSIYCLVKIEYEKIYALCKTFCMENIIILSDSEKENIVIENNSFNNIDKNQNMHEKSIKKYSNKKLKDKKALSNNNYNEKENLNNYDCSAISKNFTLNYKNFNKHHAKNDLFDIKENTDDEVE